MPMKRTSLFLEERLLKALNRAAKQRQVSVASLIREAVAEYLSGSVSGGRLPSVAGRFSSKHSDTAARHEELLWTDPHQ